MLQRIVDDSSHVPVVNQVEVHPYFGNEAVRSANASHDIATEAWSPIAQGAVLDDPVHKASKVGTKDQVVHQILGYKPSTLVTIEYLPDLGDWKTAWDHIHFQGFLGSKMTLQFTWQGCDSLLAAPLAIDWARLTEFEKRRGGKGLMRHLASFFKGPEGVEENDFFKQFGMLEEYVAKARR